MTPGIRRLSICVIGCLLTNGATAADTCECPDIADLRNRESESRAAIQAYRNALLTWGPSPPDGGETSRKHFQTTQIQPAINAVTSSGTNKARGNTDVVCASSIEPSSKCMMEVAAQHENRHAAACHAHRFEHPMSPTRWRTLADYAIEEIEAYESEAAFVHGTLVSLTTRCQLDIEMTSDITGGLEVTQSHAKAQVLATFTAPDHQPTTPYKGNGQLTYTTKDAGPPKKVGDKQLMKLMKACYAASEGSGTTPFDVIDGYLWRSNVPPYEPRLDLLFEIHATNETRKLKGERGCPKQSTPGQPFFSKWFVVDKTTPTAPNHVLIDDWVFAPSPDIFAEKVLTGTCGKKAPLPGKLAPYGPLPPCAEKTRFTIRLKSN